MLTGPDELLAAADALDALTESHAGAAAELRVLAALVVDPDPRKFQRYVLRRIKWTYYPGMTKTAAARLIASEWHAWANDRGDDLPDTIGNAFARLERAGIGPVAYRTILDDLDVSLD